MRRYFPLLAAFLSTAMAADIPIREVILYKSGVGYFERGGTLRSGESARLDFKASDMNDVLKSLTISGQNGGKVTGLRYDSSEPLAEKPFAQEFIRKYGDNQVRVDGLGDEGDLKHVENFLDCVRSRQQPNCPADLGYKVMATCDLSVRSYRNGKVYYFDSEREMVVEKA